MKKNKIILINILLIVLVYLILEFCSALICLHRYGRNFKDFFASDIKMGWKVKLFNPETCDKHYREPVRKSSNNNPIVIFGCSYAWGSGYSTDVVGEIISNLTDRTVYNRAFGGMGPQMMLYQLQSGKIKELTDDVSYIIYIFAADAEERTMKFRNWPFLPYIGIKYKLTKDDTLKLQIPNIYQTYSNIYRLIEDSFPMLYGKKYYEYLYYKIVEESYKEVKKQFPNSKFIILNYWFFPMPYQKEIEKLGIKVFSTPQLTDEDLETVKYKMNDNLHPNKAAWELILPVFVEKAEIK